MNEGIKKATKLPVTIEYVTWNGTNEIEVMEFVGKGRLKVSKPPHSMEYSKDIPNEGYTITIPTLQGDMIAKRTDRIIKGVKGECYPCDFKIFVESYDFED